MAGREIEFNSAEELQAARVDITEDARDTYTGYRTVPDRARKEEVAWCWYPRTRGIIDRTGSETTDTVITFSCKFSSLLD